MRQIYKYLILLYFTLIIQSLFAGVKMPGDTLDVVHYDISLSVTNMTTRVISGKTEVTFTVKQPSVNAITLELKQLQVDSVKSLQGIHLEYTHSGNRLSVILPATMSPNDTSLVTIWYHGVPFSEGWGGFQFSGNYAYNLGVGFQSIPHNLGKAWFPCVDDFTDKALYDYHIRVTNQNSAVCGGLLQSVVSNNDGTRTFNWKTFKPIPTYLASVAVGPYVLKSDTFVGMEGEIPITYYVRPADTNKVNGSFQNMKAIASIFENQFGPYPFNRIGITATELGAMEHTENIAYPYSSITGNSSSEWLYAHELSHMWFGNKVTCATDADMWLNEGMARWCEIIFTEFLYGKAAADDYYKQLLHNVLKNTHIADGGYRALSPMPSQYTYGSTVYDKGAVVTHALRSFIGDSLFFRGIKHYLNTFAYGNATSYQLRDVLNQSAGVDLNGFFDFYVFNPGFTHFSVDSFVTVPKCGQYQVEVYLRQKLRGTNNFAWNVPVELTFIDENRDIFTQQIFMNGERDTAYITSRFIPVAVMADMYDRSGDATTDQFKTVKNTGLTDFTYTYCKLDVKQVSDSAFVRVTHNWVAPDQPEEVQPGLRYSTNRYWLVEGIFPQGFNATGIFSYNRSQFENDILFTSADSLVILYRENSGKQWQSVNFNRVGAWQIGNIYVPDLKPGQYTLAAWDAAYVGYNIQPVQKFMQIYPNPAIDSFNISTTINQGAKVKIYDSTGRHIHTQSISSSEAINFKAMPGVYLVNLYDKKSKVASAKAVIK